MQVIMTLSNFRSAYFWRETERDRKTCRSLKGMFHYLWPMVKNFVSVPKEGAAITGCCPP
jgi:hypothetical protein